jgi:hypothetical protein
MPFWRYHAETVAGALSSLETGSRLVVAGHSGAGTLLPPLPRRSAAPWAADAVRHLVSRLR